MSKSDQSIQCFVYKGALKEDHFLFLPCRLDDLRETKKPEAKTATSEASLSSTSNHDALGAATQQALMDAEIDRAIAVQSYRTLPNELLTILGELSFVTEFELHPERYLQQSDPQKVLAALESQGFYLQVPKESSAELEERYFGAPNTQAASE